MTASTHQALTTVLNHTRVIHRHSSNTDSEQLIESDDGDQLRVTSQHSDRESAVLFIVVILMKTGLGYVLFVIESLDGL